MDDQNQPLALLNVFEIEVDGARRHLVCFLDSILAGAQGIDEHSVVGEFTPGPDREFDIDTFSINPAFVEAFTSYMNEVTAQTPEIIQEALGHASGWLYILDPRFVEGDAKGEPDPSDMLGCFAVDGSGQIVPRSFIYNREHNLFDAGSGVSGILSDRRFYDWIHPLPDSSESKPKI